MFNSLSFYRKLESYPTLKFILEIAAYSVIVILLYSLNVWFVTLAPILFFPLIIGIISAIFFTDRRKALLVAGLSGLVGTLINYNFMNVANLINFLNAMPQNINRDTKRIVYKIIVFTVKNNNLLNNSNVTRTIIVSAVIAVFCLFTVYFIFYGLYRRWYGRNILIYVLLALTFTNTIFTLVSSSEGLRNDVDKAPIDEKYTYDGIDYLRIFYEMRNGQNYYQAFVTSLMGDRRFSDSNSQVFNPKLIRQPWLFYFWKLTAENGSQLVLMAIILSILASGIFVLSINSNYGSSAAAISLLLLIPYLFMANVWANVFLPDWWAALLILIAVAGLLAKKYGLSALFAFLAGICRESMIFFTFSAMLVALYKRKFKIALYYGISSLMIFSAYITHLFLGKYFLPLSHIPAEHRFVFGFNPGSFINASSYLMFPYGFYKIPAAGIILILAIFACSFIKDRVAGFTLVLFFMFFIGYTLFIHTSSYWGQQFMPVALGMLPTLFFTGK